MTPPRKPLTVVDLFAGPGGLGEGFAAYRVSGKRAFRIGLSIERDREAHRTLTLRSFFREFDRADLPADYYAHLQCRMTRDELFARHPREASRAQDDAWLCELGVTDEREVDRRIGAALRQSDDWVLIGGPPCQAYSLVGRARMRGSDPEKFQNDPRHFLYREYLRIIARHQPPVFVMENVKGLLSATHNGSNMFDRILEDLQQPRRALNKRDSRALRYRLHALSEPRQALLERDSYSPEDFVLRAEEFGIPQARHRIIIVGVREDLKRRPTPLKVSTRYVPVKDVIHDLPALRSRLSRGEDSRFVWQQALDDCTRALRRLWSQEALLACAEEARHEAGADLPTGDEFVRWAKKPRYQSEWYSDPRLGGVCNHVSRSHLSSDIQRYFFAAVFANSMNGDARSPRLSDFPAFLLPNHRNVQEAITGKMFADRFRVQLADRPSTTVTSHIAKDGHYYIHPDPRQARSLTVREAARLQTFPDNYLFCGSRTSQYHQVGNAVPPLLALQIAEVVYDLLR